MAAVWRVGTQLEIYKDGVQIPATLEITGSPSGMRNNNTPVRIGNFTGGGGDAGHFDGLIDEPRIYNCALSAQEIQDLATICPCDIFATSDFLPPMGKKKKLGSTLPVKFELSFNGLPVTSQEELDAILVDAGCDPACPEIVLFDVTDAAEALEIELPDDSTNVGGGGDCGFCFRFSDGNWIYNLDLDSTVFEAGHTYMVEIVIGDCSFVLGNDLFQTK